MNKAELESCIREVYSAEPDYPWVKYPNFAVFRHLSTKKWFALVMNIPKKALGLSDSGTVDVVNLKCDPILMGSVLQQPGIFPGYHMNKDSWISVSLDGSVPEDTVKMLLDVSYRTTAPKAPRKKRKETEAL